MCLLQNLFKNCIDIKFYHLQQFWCSSETPFKAEASNRPNISTKGNHCVTFRLPQTRKKNCHLVDCTTALWPLERNSLQPLLTDTVSSACQTQELSSRVGFPDELQPAEKYEGARRHNQSQKKKKKDLSPPCSLFVRILETIQSNFFPLATTHLSTDTGQSQIFMRTLLFKSWFFFKDWLSNVMPEPCLHLHTT